MTARKTFARRVVGWCLAGMLVCFIAAAVAALLGK